MTKFEIEKRIQELKQLQGNIMGKKKAERDLTALEAARKELGELKAKVKVLYKG
jgi:chaperonin cofactor prefoldin